MILFELRCRAEHHFEAWFRDGATYDKQAAGGEITCPVCGDTVRSVFFAERSLEYCPTCQTGGTPLADRRMSRLLH